METDGVKHITLEDRKSCFIIYINPAKVIRQTRMVLERGWTMEEVDKRLKTDRDKFEGFSDYDLILTDPEF